MLKIKDSVDLKELEKFGFYKNDWSEYGYTYLVPDINESGRCKVEIHTSRYRRLAFEIEGQLHGLPVPSIIFDLIQAGLVEKGE